MVSLRFLASATLIAVAAASPFGLLKRQGGGKSTSVTCGSNTYSSSDLDGASSAGCTLHFAGDTVGDNEYPHTFNNREGLPLEGDGPYQEFPILTDGIYDGGKLAGAWRGKVSSD